MKQSTLLPIADAPYGDGVKRHHIDGIIHPAPDNFLNIASEIGAMAHKGLRLAFGEGATNAVLAAMAAVMAWHCGAISDPVAGGAQIADDCLWASPWLAVWIFREIKDVSKTSI
ncbi:MAG: hypothetical protein NC102_00165 [Clostridium sp.]|nr:hypothetical protein [Clostridium sp.]